MSRGSRCIVKVSAAAALVVVTLAPAAEGAAPGFYFPPPSAPAEPAPFAGQHNYGTEHQAFRWGWFGAEHFYPTQSTHRETTGDVMRWSRWRRY